MGVNRIDGQDLAALSARIVGRTPAPQLRSAEAASGLAQEVRETPKPDEDQMQRAARPTEAAVLMRSASRPRFRVDEASEQLVAQLINEHNEVIKQIPPEEMLRIASRLRQLKGLLFDERI